MKSNFFTRPLTRGIIATFALVLCAPENSAATTIDEISNLNYWLAQAPVGKGSDWEAKTGITNSEVEDGPDPSGYLGPGFGGQHYDAEAIYVELTQDFLNIAVVTGLNPDNPQKPGSNSYAPGDIAIDFGYSDVSPSFELGIVTNNVARSGFAPGDIYLVGDTGGGWEYGIWNGPGESAGGQYTTSEEGFRRLEHPTIVIQGENIGPTASFYYGIAEHGNKKYSTEENDNKLGGQDDGTDNHYLIAASISLQLLENFDSANGTNLFTKLNAGGFLVHWTMRCANDYIQVDPAGVPEPSPLLLMLGSLFTLTAFQRFRKA
jgi:hypothetical protein